MTDYTKLVHDIRAIADEMDCKYCGIKGRSGGCKSCVLYDAADAIEALQKDLTALQKCYEIADTTVDEVLKQLPKRGEWIGRQNHKKCSVCGKQAIYDVALYTDMKTPYCPHCGAKMEVQE